MKNNPLHHIFLFAAGACAYPVIEILYRGRTHYSMALAGGACLCAIDSICLHRLKNRTGLLRCAAGAGAITGIEFVFGVVFNLLLRQNVWDYSHLPLNVLGQVCLPFYGVWMALCVPAQWVCAAVDTGADKLLARRKKHMPLPAREAQAPQLQTFPVQNGK